MAHANDKKRALTALIEHDGSFAVLLYLGEEVGTRADYGVFGDEEKARTIFSGMHSALFLAEDKALAELREHE